MWTRRETLQPHAQILLVERRVEACFKRAFGRCGGAIETQQGPIVGGRHGLSGDRTQQGEQQNKYDDQTGQTKLHESLPKRMFRRLRLLSISGMPAEFSAKSAGLEPFSVMSRGLAIVERCGSS